MALHKTREILTSTIPSQITKHCILLSENTCVRSSCLPQRLCNTKCCQQGLPTKLRVPVRGYAKFLQQQLAALDNIFVSKQTSKFHHFINPSLRNLSSEFPTSKSRALRNSKCSPCYNSSDHSTLSFNSHGYNSPFHNSNLLTSWQRAALGPCFTNRRNYFTWMENQVKLIRQRYRPSDTDDSENFNELPMLFRHKKGGPSLESLARRSLRVKKQKIKVEKQDMLICSAYATAEEYNLDALKNTLLGFGSRFRPVKLPQDADGVLFMHIVESSKELWEDAPTEIIFFEEGTVVFWNASPYVESEVLWMLENHQRGPYDKTTVYEENERINYRHEESDTHLSSKGVITLDNRDMEKLPLEKFAYSNAMMHSVKLAMWEDSLDQFVDSIEHIPDNMSLGKPIKMSREEVMRKRGQLFALRHRINLTSDLLIASDFYWDRDNLEALYQKMCHFYNIGRRTRVMNEKLTHCSELVELMRTHLSEKHSTRLEWMIILLILVEVVFECIHYAKSYLVNEETHSMDQHEVNNSEGSSQTLQATTKEV